jgi:hypothetical protein
VSWHRSGPVTAALLFAVAAAGVGPGSADAPAPLEALARRAAAQPVAAALAPGALRERSWRSTILVTRSGPRGSFTWLERRRSTQWARADGSGRRRSECQSSAPVGPRDRARWRAAGSPGSRACAREEVVAGPGELASTVPLAHRLGSLPTEPGRLAATLGGVGVGSGRAPRDDGGTFTLVGDLLEDPLAHPSLRAALIRVLAGLGGVRVLGAVKDPLGRPGLAVGRRSGPFRLELILDRRTTGVLSERAIVLSRLDWADARAEQVLAWAAYLSPPGR